MFALFANALFRQVAFTRQSLHDITLLTKEVCLTGHHKALESLLASTSKDQALPAR